MRTDHALQLRAEVLSKYPGACVARELWSCGSGTYSAYRDCLLARRQRGERQRGEARAAYGGGVGSPNNTTGQGGGGRKSGLGWGGPVPSHSLPATVKYSFEGVKHVLAESAAAVSVVAFASLRSDLLAFGCVDGELWVVSLPAAPTGQTPPACNKTRKMHAQAIQALDWTYDNSQLLSVGRDGSLCVWDTTSSSAALGAAAARAVGMAPPGQGPQGQREAPTCIRSVSMPTTSFLCGRFHRLNFSLAMVGTSGGWLEMVNCSTGMSHSRYKVPPSGSTPVQVTALDSSNHHVFLGDSSGTLHMYACELHGRQLTQLRPVGRLKLALSGSTGAAGGAAAGEHHSLAAAAGVVGGGGGGGVAVSALQYVAFCHATDSPVLLAALQDGSLCIVKANETRHTAELHLRRFVAPPSLAAVSPYTALRPPSTPLHRPAATSTSPSSSHPDGSAFGLPASSSPATAAAATAAATAAAAAATMTLLRLSPAICPLSVIHDVPLITYGSDDTSVYIVDVTTKSYAGGAGGRGRAGGPMGRDSAAAGGAAAAGMYERPLTVTVLKAHRAPVTCVAWSYDEALLASADADGIVVLWQRSRLF